MDTGFFKWLWRFNAVVIALAAASFLAMSAVFLIGEISGLFFNGTMDDAVPVSAADATAPEVPLDLQLGMIEHPEGSDVMRVALRTGDRYASSYSKYPSSSTLNIGIVDPDSLATRWLFPADHTLILQTMDVLRNVRDVAGTESIAAQASLYLVVQEDTNKDGALSSLDRAEVMISDVDGSGLKVLTEATGLSQTMMLDGATELLVYTDATGQKLARLDLPSLSLQGDAVSQAVP